MSFFIFISGVRTEEVSIFLSMLKVKSQFGSTIGERSTIDYILYNNYRNMGGSHKQGRGLIIRRIKQHHVSEGLMNLGNQLVLFHHDPSTLSVSLFLWSQKTLSTHPSGAPGHVFDYFIVMYWRYFVYPDGCLI
jgi:hypothetical protein